MRAVLYTVVAAALIAGAAFAGWRSARPRLPQAATVVLHEEIDAQRHRVAEREARRIAQSEFERSLPSRVTLLRRELTEPGLRVSRVTSVDQNATQRLVHVHGEVVRDGSYTFSDGMTFGDAIEKAGGLSQRGDTTHITVLRVMDGKTRRLTVKANDFVRPDDVIQVPRRIF